MRLLLLLSALITGLTGLIAGQPAAARAPAAIAAALPGTEQARPAEAHHKPQPVRDALASRRDEAVFPRSLAPRPACVDERRIE